MDTLEDRLESYLTQLMSICGRWTAWITEQEQAAVLGNYRRLEELTTAADGVLAEIQELHRVRQTLLDDAKVAGWPSTDLYTLAQALPSWANRAQRERVRTAKRQMDQLRRLHLAIWVLISHCERFASETMLLLCHGRMEASVYSATGNADTSGGHLLDAQI